MSATQLGRLLANAAASASGAAQRLRKRAPAARATSFPVRPPSSCGAVSRRCWRCSTPSPTAPRLIFARTFYESLVDGLPVDAAVVESRVAISLAIHNTVEWGTPVLHMRSPDGILFRLTAPRAPVTVPEPRHSEPVPEEQPEERVTSAPELQPDFTNPASYPELHPKPGPVLADVNAYNSRGGNYYQAEDYLAALADFNSAIELSPEYAVAYFNRGSTYYMLKRPDKALADYTRVIELRPGDSSAYFCRGDTYLALQQSDAGRFRPRHRTRPRGCLGILRYGTCSRLARSQRRSLHLAGKSHRPGQRISLYGSYRPRFRSRP